MARPCGCGTGGVIVRCGTGLVCTGVGTSGDPLVISWEIPIGTAACNAVMDCVGASIGSGLQYFPLVHRVAAKVSTDAGNTLGFGSDGGLLATGSSDPSLGGVTVAGLPTSNLLASSYGAGFSVWPDGYLASYEAVMADEHVSLIHVPVRRSQEFLLYAVHDRNLGWYTNDTFTNAPVPVRYTHYVDVPWSHLMRVHPSGLPDSYSSDSPYNTLYGYFGYGNVEQQGILQVEDVFRTTARRKCLYLEVKDMGGSGDTPTPAYTYFHLVALVQKWGLQKSVIIAGELPTGDQDVAGIKQGLQYAKANGIEIGAHLTSIPEATANPPASLVSLGCTWVGLSYGIPQATVQTYKDAGLSVLMFTADRQWHWTQQQTYGVRGAICSDPVYAAAHTYSFRYREINPPSTAPHPFSGQSAKYGVCGYSGTLLGVHARLRGWTDRSAGSDGILKSATDMVPPSNSGFNIPAGPFNPIFDRALPDPPPQGNYGSPNNYDVEVGVRVIANSGWQAGGQQGLGLFLCVPSDVRLFDLTAATTNTIGYSFILASNGNFVFRRYSGEPGNYAYLLAWASGWGNLANNRAYTIGVQVRPDSIRCGPLTENGGISGVNSRLFTATNPANAGGDMHRGAYLYCSFINAPGFDGYRHFENLKVTNFS